MRILVVDDHDFVRNEIVKGIKEHGHTVHEAPSGEHAVSMLPRLEIDMVITDLNMVRGGLTGIDLIVHVRKTKPKVRVWLMSVDIKIKTVEEALGHGAEQAVDKNYIHGHLKKANIIKH